MRVCWRGDLYSAFSLAFVNRRIVRALIERDNLDVVLCSEPVVVDLLEPDFRELALRAARGHSDADFTIVNDLVPMTHGIPASSRFIRYLPWEFGSMPRIWYDYLHVECDDLWTPSTHNSQAFISDGFPSERVATVPYGVDTRVFDADTPSGSKNDRFRFLFVGGATPRKGIDVLVNAYLRAFTSADAVTLTIKDVNAQSFYRGKSKGADLVALTQMSGIPKIEYIDATITDRQMAQVYHESDCLVLAYRGEGFAMPVLEAMACGLPVIVTAGGATDDFVDETVGWRIPSTRVPCPPDDPVPTMSGAWLLEADVQALARTMQYAYANREEARARGQAGARRALQWTWDNSARIIEQRLFELASRPPTPATVRDARYHNAQVYAEERSGPTRADGVLLEIFRRIGVDEPQYVEITSNATAQLTSVLEIGMRWSGYVFDPSSTSDGVENALAARGIRTGFDVLALDCEDASAVWEALRGMQPRVVAVAAALDDAVSGTARDLGYTAIARNGDVGQSVYVRDDLFEATGFDRAP